MKHNEKSPPERGSFRYVMWVIRELLMLYDVPVRPK